MRNLWQQLGVVVRGMLRQPNALIPVLLILGLGLGAAAMAVNFYYSLLIGPWRYKDSDSLRNIVSIQPELSSRRSAISYPDFEDWRRDNEVFEDMAAASMIFPVVLTGGDRAEHLTMEMVTSNLFPMLGVEASLGRVIEPSEDRMPGGAPVVMISDHLWRQRFGGDPGILGQTLQLNQVSFMVVGVIEPWFQGFFWDPVDLWLPMSAAESVLDMDLTRRDLRRLQAFGRVQPGVTDAEVHADMERVTATLREAYPASNDLFHARVMTLSEAFFEHAVERLRIGVLAAMLLLVLCTINIAGLLLTRSAGRDCETALRLALGARWSQLARLWLLEGAVLGIAGGILGLILAISASHWLLGLSDLPPSTFEFRSAQGPVVLTTLTLGVVAGAIAGLVPLLRLPSPSMLPRLLRSGGRQVGVGEKPLVTIVVVELALALALLYGAGLMVTSSQRLLVGDPGYDADRLLSLAVDLTNPRYEEDASTLAYLKQVETEVTALPGIQSATWVGGYPPPDARSAMPVVIEDHLTQPEPSPLRVYRQRVTPSYFDTLGIELLDGRGFESSDHAEAPLVAVITRELAEFAWPDEQEVLGKRLRLGQVGATDRPWLTVVGVVEKVTNRLLKDTLTEGQDLDMYTALYQDPVSTPTLLVRAADPEGLQALVTGTVNTIDPDVPSYDVGTVRSKMAIQAQDDIFLGAVMALYAGLALIISVLGVYGVLAYLVRQRRQEIGVRMALGADASRVRLLVLSQGLRWVILGLVLGLPLAFWLGRIMQTLLYQVDSFEPFLLVIALTVLLVAALAALWVPSHRATRVDPMVALRQE